MSGTENANWNPGCEVTEYNVHIPVMLTEVLSYLRKDVPDYVVVDMTIGRAGHAANILSTLGANCFLYGFDRDIDAIDYSQKKLGKYGSNFKLFKDRFSDAIRLLRSNGVKGADFILFDIGVSSPQFDDPERGFSYRFDAPLDMRMDQGQKLTARMVVNDYSPADLERILRDYGGETFALPIAEAIVKARKEKPIATTFELVDVIKGALPERILHHKGHPAKKAFMAIRYEVNDERKELERALNDSIRFLNLGGRVCVITFNSDEDALVKKTFQSYCPQSVISRFLPPLPGEGQQEYRILTHKPVKPSKAEEEVNPRAESALMRVLERSGV